MHIKRELGIYSTKYILSSTLPPTVGLKSDVTLFSINAQ